MTIAFNELHDAHLGYAAILLCLCFGFVFLKIIYKNKTGPGFWAISFAFNAVGFLLWSGIVPVKPIYYYFFGEVFHVTGFFLFVYGALRFTKVKNIWKYGLPFLVVWLAIWAFSIVMLRSIPLFAGIALKLLRAILFMIAGGVLLLNKNEDEPVGKNTAGASLLLWSSYIVVATFVSINRNLYFGFLVGLHVLAAFGMVAMLVDKIRVESTRIETKVEQLEGILPICCYCKKIRDETGKWKMLEEYIEDRSKAEFSHGICPDCMIEKRPDR